MEENSTGSNEVVVLISGAEGGSEVSTQDQDFGHFEHGSYSFPIHTLVDPPVAKPDSVQSRKQMPPFTSFMPLEITKLSPKSAIKSPDGPVTRRRLVRQSLYSKPKSRLVESAYPSSWKVGDANNGETVPTLSPSVVPAAAASARVDKVKTAPVTPRTPLIGSIRGNYVEDNDDDDDEVYQLGNLEVGGKKIRKFSVVASIEWVAFLCMMAFLTVILTISKLKDSEIWSLELWKWCVLGLVMFCGRLFTEWLINFIVFAVEKNYLYKRKVLYFIYSLKKSTCAFVWLFLVFLAWVLLIDGGVRRSRRTTKILHYITRTLISGLIGAALWVIKTFLVKLLASYFHVRRFFDKIQETIFQQYVLQTLSGPPLMEDADGVGSSSAASGRMCFKSTKKGKQKEDVIDVMKLQTMKREKVSAWTMGGLVKVIRNSGLSILSNALDSDDDNESVEQNIKMITDEWEAKAAAARIFKHVSKPDHNYIDEEDLLRFVSTMEVDNVFLLFEGAIEKGKIKKSTFSNWVVNVYKERKFLRHSLNDSKTAIEELHRLVAGIVVIVIIIAWLLLMEFTTTTVLLFIASQLLVLVFIFGNTLKTTFEAIIFIFVMHPFDVGDRCVIDGVQMVVEEMNILTTIFLRTDNEKVYYPNSVLADKVISNYNRSPKMSDSVEFCIDVSTSADIIAALKARIKAYLESKPENWRPEHSVQIKEIENVDKLRMALNVTHTMNFQNYGVKSSRRSKLLLELKRIFEELGIIYHLLPQQVRIR